MLSNTPACLNRLTFLVTVVNLFSRLLVHKCCFEMPRFPSTKRIRQKLLACLRCMRVKSNFRRTHNLPICFGITFQQFISHLFNSNKPTRYGSVYQWCIWPGITTASYQPCIQTQIRTQIQLYLFYAHTSNKTGNYVHKWLGSPNVHSPLTFWLCFYLHPNKNDKLLQQIISTITTINMVSVHCHFINLF